MRKWRTESRCTGIAEWRSAVKLLCERKSRWGRRLVKQDTGLTRRKKSCSRDRLVVGLWVYMRRAGRGVGQGSGRATRRSLILLLIYWDTELLRRSVTELPRHWVTETLSYWDTELLNYWDTELPRHRVTETLSYWDTELLIHQVTETLSHWITETLSYWVTETELLRHRVTETLIYLVTETLNYWDTELLRRWVTELPRQSFWDT